MNHAMDKDITATKATPMPLAFSAVSYDFDGTRADVLPQLFDRLLRIVAAFAYYSQLLDES